MDKLQADFEDIERQLQAAKQLLEPWGNARGDSAKASQAHRIAPTFIGLLTDAQADIEQRFHRQRASLVTVNMAFFGRTGAGKSSLIEAFTHGDGASVSQGESDWTVDVRPVSWNGCQLIDTPGINGWGRTARRVDLEERARRAVETADIVMLCFDSQSQQESEFQKVAEWISTYGKPAIAVLNCRNQLWRFPARVAQQAQRRSQSLMVHQHVGNILDGLSSLGLTQVPVVAISSKRALVARGKEPFCGPDAVTFAKLRKEFGPETMLKWSNLPALESLLVETLTSGASAIRLGMLVANLRGILSHLDQKLLMVVAEAEEANAVLDRTITTVLKVVGYPAQGSKVRKLFVDSRVATDLVDSAEELRGNAFEAPLEGEFRTHANYLLTAHLGQIRSKTLQRAEEFVIDAFNEGKQPDTEAFKEEVYRKQEMIEASAKILEQGLLFLQNNIQVVMRTAQAEIAISERASDVKGRTGSIWGKVAVGARAAGIAAGSATTVAMGLAAVNVWNPGGWVLGLVTIGGGILSTILGWIGGKSARKAEEARTKARREALASARVNVENTMDEFIGKVSAAAEGIGREAAVSVLTPLLEDLIAARLVLQSARATHKRFATLAQALPEMAPQAVISAAARSVEAVNYPGHLKAADLVWRGDDWITDPLGLGADHRPAAARAATVLHGDAAPGLQALLEVQWRAPFNVSVWLAKVRKATASLPRWRFEMRDLEQLASRPVPRFYIFGDYNAGKSSFIKRLLLEDGRTIPDSLAVRADATTSAMHSYPWNDVLLVDTPGLQSRRDADTRRALASYADASFMICLLQPSMLASTIAWLSKVLPGDASMAVASKLERTLFIISRADELGPDPEEDLQEYKRACDRKRKELLQALARHDVILPPERVLFMSADPYGLVGDRIDVDPSHFERFSGWDGVAQFRQAVSAMSARARNVAGGYSVLDRGSMRLGQQRAELLAESERLVRRSELLQRLIQKLGVAIDEGESVFEHIAGKLDRLINEATDGLINDALGAATEVEVEHASNALVNWWKAKHFVDGLKGWEKISVAAVDTWSRRTSDEIGRSLHAARLVEVEANASTYDGPKLGNGPKGKSGWWNTLENSVKASGSRDVVYRIGKMVGTKFKPYGAINLASKIAKVGAVLSAVGVVLDGWSWAKDLQDTKKREQARLRAVEYLHNSGIEVRDSILSEGASGGVRVYMQTKVAEFQAMRGQVQAEWGEVEKQRSALQIPMNKIEALLKAASKTR